MTLEPGAFKDVEVMPCWGGDDGSDRRGAHL